MNELPKLENPTEVIFEQKMFMDGEGRELTMFSHFGGQLTKNFPRVQWRGYGTGTVNGQDIRFEFWIRNTRKVEEAFAGMLDAARAKLALIKKEAGEVDTGEVTEILKLQKDGSTKKEWEKPKGNNGTNRIDSLRS